jgi:dihydroflavonol-4-reductase
VFVTGATGFLGMHLVARLRDRGHEVTALVRADDPALAALGVVQRRGDVLDRSAVHEAAAGAELAFHCAGRVSRDPDDAEALYRVHVEGTKTVLDACRDAGVKRIVVASSSGTVAVSDDPTAIATETDETPIGLIARWPYYRAKLFAERAALERNVRGSFEVVSVNPTLLLGPGDLRGSSTDDVRLFLDRKLPAIPAGGLSFVDVRDAAEGMILAAEKGAPGERYLLGACNLTVRDFFGKLERVSGVKGPWLLVPRAPELTRLGMKAMGRFAARLGATLPVDPVSVDMSSYFWYLDATRAETVLGWTARDPMETLADTVADLRARGVVWPEPRSA